MKIPKIDKIAAVLLSFGLFFYIIVSVPWMLQRWSTHMQLIKFNASHPTYMRDGCLVVVVDHCEYLSHVDNSLAHKGNCTNSAHIYK